MSMVNNTDELYAKFLQFMNSSDALKSSSTEKNTASSTAEMAEQVKKCYENFMVSEAFIPGCLVVWKEKMKNRKMPEYSQPAVVMEVLDCPVIDPEKEVASCYYGEPLSVRLGFIDSDGDFVSYLFDKRRFRRFPEQNS